MTLVEQHKTEFGTLYHGDCLTVLPTLGSSSVDAIVTDPPSGIGFIGSDWDSFEEGLKGFQDFLTQVFTETLRIIKPGGYLIAWSFPRTAHHTGMAIERAGFEVRDSILHLKDRSPEVRAFLDTLTDAQKELLAQAYPTDNLVAHVFGQGFPKSSNHLKPAAEIWWLARKPPQGTLEANRAKYGTGYLNIEAVRIGDGKDKGVWPITDRSSERKAMAGSMQAVETDFSKGRWPTNMVLSHSDTCYETRGGTHCVGSCPVEGLALQSPEESAKRLFKVFSPFVYEPKTSTKERNAGGVLNPHPTAKSLRLMRYLLSLVLEEGGTVLDPFAGSGSSLEAAIRWSRRCRYIGIEKDASFFEFAKNRMDATVQDLGLDYTDLF